MSLSFLEKEGDGGREGGREQEGGREGEGEGEGGREREREIYEYTQQEEHFLHF